MKVLNFGSLNIDNVYSLEHFVGAGETVSALSCETFVGGKGLNQSVALSCAGAEVYHAGAVGEEDGKILVDTLEKYHIDTTYVERVASPSGNAVIQVEREGNNAIIVCAGANGMISEGFIDKVLSHFSKNDILLLQNEINNVSYIINRASEKGMYIVFNPSPMNDGVFKLPLEKVNCFILNETEASEILRTDVSDNLDDGLLKIFPFSAIVLTLGEKGSIYRNAERKITQKSYRIKAVDTTGAGDTFTGFFIGRISCGDSIENALDFASRAAAISVTVKGASNSVPDAKTVENFVFQK